jgi:hypothetical protein
MSSYCPPARAADWLESETEQDWRPKPSIDVLVKLALIDELVAKALANAKPVPAALPLEQKFQELAAIWERETSHVSSLTKKVMHPSYQTIMGMGPNVVPLLIRDMQQNRRDWFWALHHLTQANPVSSDHSGKLDKMIAAWVNWGKERNLL